MSSFIAGFFTAGAIGYVIKNPGVLNTFRSEPPKFCKYCGRTVSAAMHEGFNGYFLDDNMACQGKYSYYYIMKKENERQARERRLQQQQQHASN